MSLTIDQNIHNFTVTRIQPVSELSAELIEMRHDKTGAQLVWLKNSGENKLFSIGFKTTPSDDTGVFHILEHSVLCGSDKYPVKDPFLELMKSSMNTFLNAMTYPDKTIFPVSSRNDTDFMNLTRVYLDAVFRPSIYTNPCIFQQEGWHIEWRSKDEEPLYKGVVFNEMKGALSSVYNRIETELGRLLFPDTCYRWESGGDPVSIPDLTYERFIEDHRRFYHPSNSYIYLDGPVDIEALLELIDGEYLSHYDRLTGLPEIAVQQPVTDNERRCFYEITPDESPEKKTHLVIGKVFGTWKDREKVFASEVLAEYLTGSNDAPLKRALLDTGLCLDASLQINDGVFQPSAALMINNTDESGCPELIETVRSTVAGVIEKGLDRESLAAAINNIEFRTRESREPKGLIRNVNALSAWLYGGDPIWYLELGGVFTFLREQLDTDYYSKLLAELLLDETGQGRLYLLPSHTYGAEQRADEEKRVAGRISALTEAEQSALIEENARLDKWQQTEDTPEAMSTLPRLPLTEVSDQPLHFDTDASEESGVTILRHTAQEKGIAAICLYFEAADFTTDELTLLALMSDLLGELPTEKSDGLTLQRRITGLLGGLNFTVGAFGTPGKPESCRPMFIVRTRFLQQLADKALELVSEIITGTDYTDTGLIKELILQTDEDMRQSIVTDGHRYAMRRVRASLSAEGAVDELVSGYEGYKQLHAIAGDDSRIDSLPEKLRAISAKLFTRSRLTVSITSAEQLSPASLIAALPQGNAPAAAESFISLDIPARQGLLIPSGVSYSGMSLSGHMTDRPLWQVLSTVLSLEYLWNEVRVKGGAYGTGANLSLQNDLAFYSYRDPSPAGAVATFEKSAEFLRRYISSGASIAPYIISTIAGGEPLQLDYVRGITADSHWFRGITYEQRLADRRRMLSLTADELLTAAEALENTAAVCVIGSEKALGELSGLTLETVS